MSNSRWFLRRSRTFLYMASGITSIDNRFNSMDARFMTLDEQIEAVQNQIFDLQYVDDEWREKQPVDVSKQPIVFYGCISFSIFSAFVVLNLMY